jgi:hypothetical protein
MSFFFSHAFFDSRSYIRVLRPIIVFYSRAKGCWKLCWRFIFVSIWYSIGCWDAREFASDLLLRRNENSHYANAVQISNQNLMKFQTWNWEERTTIFTRNTIFLVNHAFLHSRSYVPRPIMLFFKLRFYHENEGKRFNYILLLHSTLIYLFCLMSGNRHEYSAVRKWNFFGNEDKLLNLNRIAFDAFLKTQ